MALIRPIASSGFTPLTKNKLYVMGDANPTDLVSGSATIPLTNYKDVTLVFNSSDFTTLTFTPNGALTGGVQVFNKGQLVKNTTQSFPAAGASIDISGGDTTIFSTLTNTSGNANNSTIALS